jgi:hypothetical protein
MLNQSPRALTEQFKGHETDNDRSSQKTILDEGNIYASSKLFFDTTVPAFHCHCFN